MTALVVALGMVVAILTLLVVGLLRSHAEILRRLHELDGGEQGAGGQSGAIQRSAIRTFPQIPEPPERTGFTSTRDLSGVGADGSAVALRVQGVEHRSLVAFLSSTCLTCQRFWEAFEKPAKLGLPADVRVVIVTKGPEEESPSKVAKLASNKVPVVMSNDAWTDYDVPGSPYFVMVNGSTGQTEGEGTGIDWPQVRGLLTQIGEDAAYASSLDKRRVSKFSSDDERERRVDAELIAGGVKPGDPSLFGHSKNNADGDELEEATER